MVSTVDPLLTAAWKHRRDAIFALKRWLVVVASPALTAETMQVVWYVVQRVSSLQWTRGALVLCACVWLVSRRSNRVEGGESVDKGCNENAVSMVAGMTVLRYKSHLMFKPNDPTALQQQQQQWRGRATKQIRAKVIPPSIQSKSTRSR